MAEAVDMFLGHPVKYWVELDSRAQALDVAHLIEELAGAYAKIGFYEKRIREMSRMAAT